MWDYKKQIPAIGLAFILSAQSVLADDCFNSKYCNSDMSAQEQSVDIKETFNTYRLNIPKPKEKSTFEQLKDFRNGESDLSGSGVYFDFENRSIFYDLYEFSEETKLQFRVGREKEHLNDLSGHKGIHLRLEYNF